MGLGYVGLPLAVAFAEEGHDVVARRRRRAQGRGARPRRVLHRGHPLRAPARPSPTASRRRRARPTSRAATRCSICVPTPLTANREPDLGPLVAATRALADLLQPGQLVVLESTTYPGTTRERMAPMLEESGLVAGRDFNLAFSPERVDPGPHRLHAAQHAEGRRRPDRGVRRPRRGALPRASATDRPRLDARGRRADQAAGEHLPLGQHRAGQRDGDAHRSHGHRHLGGRRRRRDQALRLHALRARPRHGRPLPARRPVLPLAGAPASST